VLRSCRIGDNVIVGAKCSLMEGAFVEDNSILAPGSVLPPARRVPSGELWAGNPAKFVRKLTKDEVRNTLFYVLVEGDIGMLQHCKDGTALTFFACV
jgi:carbonic anhydrase/acetyltransferase-like protein (isoleucine patch superfamily)